MKLVALTHDRLAARAVSLLWLFQRPVTLNKATISACIGVLEVMHTVTAKVASHEHQINDEGDAGRGG